MPSRRWNPSSRHWPLASDAAARTPGRKGEIATAEHGYLHFGPSGSGHFVKMVHNVIDYGMMASIAEGLNILHKANIGTATQDASDAETAPLAPGSGSQSDQQKRSLPNSPSCISQPANISLTAPSHNRDARHLVNLGSADKAASEEAIQSASSPCPLTRTPTYKFTDLGVGPAHAVGARPVSS